jgi:hypothetical protein
MSRDDARHRANESRTDGDGREWRFALDEVGPDGVTEDTATPASAPIEPESITPENAFFVLLGVVLTVGVLVLGI